MTDLRDTLTRSRRDGWTGERRRAFIEGLVRAGNVRDACRTIGLSNQAAYKLRARDPAFAALWDAAVSVQRMADGAARAFAAAPPARLR